MNTPIVPIPTKTFFCNACQRKTHHRYIASVLRNDGDVGEGAQEFIASMMWACCGCDTSLLEESYAILSVDDDGDPIGDPEESAYESIVIPARTFWHVKAKSFNLLPPRLTGIYQEVLRAYNNNLTILCAIGIRTLLEGICADQEIGGKNLQSKIDGLSSILPKNIVVNLHSLRFIGNEAAHELQAPEQSDLYLAIEICGDLLNFIYELDYKASTLTKARENKRPSISAVSMETDEE